MGTAIPTETMTRYLSPARMYVKPDQTHLIDTTTEQVTVPIEAAVHTILAGIGLTGRRHHDLKTWVIAVPDGVPHQDVVGMVREHTGWRVHQVGAGVLAYPTAAR